MGGPYPLQSPLWLYLAPCSWWAKAKSLSWDRCLTMGVGPRPAPLRGRYTREKARRWLFHLLFPGVSSQMAPQMLGDH